MELKRQTESHCHVIVEETQVGDVKPAHVDKQCEEEYASWIPLLGRWKHPGHNLWERDTAALVSQHNLSLWLYRENRAHLFLEIGN